MKKKLTTFEEADSSPAKWKKFLGESKERAKAENKRITKEIKSVEKKRQKEISNPKNYPKK